MSDRFLTIGPLQKVLRSMIGEPRHGGYSTHLAYGQPPREMGRGMREVSEVVGVSLKTIERVMRRPPAGRIPVAVADRWAGRLGKHPQDIWGQDWFIKA